MSMRDAGLRRAAVEGAAAARKAASRAPVRYPARAGLIGAGGAGCGRGGMPQGVGVVAGMCVVLSGVQLVPAAAASVTPLAARAAAPPVTQTFSLTGGSQTYRPTRFPRVRW